MNSDLDLLSALAANEREVQDEGDPRYSLCKGNFGFSVFNHSQAKYSRFAKRDIKRVESIIFGEGRLQAIKNWVGVKSEMETTLTKFLHRKVKTKFVHIRGYKKKVLKINDDMWVSDFDFLVVHGDHLVYLAIPSPSVADKVYKKAVSDLGYSISVSEYDRDLMVYHGDKNKRLQYPPFSMNFGISVRPQKWGLCVRSPNNIFNSIPSFVVNIYHDYFFGVYIKQSTANVDRYHDIRKGYSRLRQKFDGDYFHIRLTLQDTYPTNNSNKKTNVSVQQLAVLEKKIWSIAEYLMCQIYFCLPYRMLPLLSFENVQQAENLVNEIHCPFFSNGENFS